MPGRFSTRPKQHVAGFISEISAAHLIYAAVLAAWVFVAVVFAWPGAEGVPAITPASIAAALMFAVVIVFALCVNLRPRKKIQARQT